MSWRVVVISKRSKLDYKMGFLVVRNEDGEARIHLGDISVLVCETTALSITAYLLAELTKQKIKVIFCDNQHNPISELIPMYGAYNTSGKIRNQIKWSAEIKAKVWQKIVQQKIGKQADNLRKAGQNAKADQLDGYAKEVTPGDLTNREGHAAKVYFNVLFDEGFYRNSDDIRNAILDYGYSVILASVNREIAAAGYLTQLGIWHDNASNPFNLGSDLMESFRPIVDELARVADYKCFEKEEKHAVLNLLNSKVIINSSEQFLSNAIGIYVQSVFNALETKDVNKVMDWYEL